MADPEHNGTEAPTPRRREEARAEGQVVFSTDLTAAVVLLAGCLVLMWTGTGLIERLMNGMRTWFMEVPSTDWTDWHTTVGAQWISGELFRACGVLVITMMVVGLAFGFAQVGFVLTLKPLAINWERILPTTGWDRLISIESGVRGLLNAAKVTFLLGLTIIQLWMRRHELSGNQFTTVGGVAAFAWRLGLSICISMAGVVIGLAIVDYLVKWFRHEQKLKMTREEVKQEQKDDMGDPHVRAAIRKKQRDARRRQSVKDVPKATVILTNPTHLAIAIQYEVGKMRAPRVLAKGAGVFAANIVRIAKENKIPVLERKPLARAIYKSVDVGQEIPFEFFRAIAEILAQIYKARRTAA